jgi:putative transcriptional regulator
MTHTTSLTNHLLLAMPQMGDKRFERSVIYVCEHTDHGALGIAINRPLEVAFADILIHLGYLHKNTEERALTQPVIWGGPCAKDRGFVLHRDPGHWKNSFVISDEVTLTTSQDIIESIGLGHGPKDTLIAFGCSRWYGGQLEREMADNAWLSVPATDFVLYDCPLDQKWGSAAMSHGIDFNRMSYDVGHA